MLVAALFLFTLLLALGIGLMSSQAARRKAALAQKEAIQAKSLALSAWADVKTKLGKDLFFPPTTDGQGHFSYGEDIYENDGAFYGSYSVVIDTRYVSKRRDQGAETELDSTANRYHGYYTSLVSERSAHGGDLRLLSEPCILRLMRVASE